MPTVTTQRRDDRVFVILDGALVVTILIAGLATLLTLLDAVASRGVTGFAIKLPEGAEGSVSARVGLGLRLAWWLVGPASGLLVILAAETLRRVVSTARAGDPLVAANVGRIRALAGLALASFVMTVTKQGVAIAIADDLGQSAASRAVSPSPLLAAAVLLGLAQVWRRGVALREGLRAAPDP